ncbi:hypothetical protein KGM_209807 [Danaus plexippus plexippus]|uniref:Uncharacterized protein n=1 Tax=Danaus plexippus plexippus TaxID=278856 RepID=A0A212EKN1_DANPL|nr:hypothetical protein KGM_209807 [Danaus plexippus plexippus]
MATSGERGTTTTVVCAFSASRSNIEKATNEFHSAGIWPIDTTKFGEQFVDASLLPLANSSNSQRAVTPDSQILPTPNMQLRPTTPLVMLNELIRKYC